VVAGRARSETVGTKPAFRAAFKRRHRLVPASGFYALRTVGKQKLPTLFQPASGLFGFAGLVRAVFGEMEPRRL